MRKSPVLCAALLAAGAAMPAGAQTILPERADVAGSRAQPDYDAVGVQIGPIAAKPSLGLTLGYDSNLFGEDSDVSRDNYVVVSPALSVRSDWGIDGFALSASGDFTRYMLFPRQNTDEFSVSGSGNINLGEATVTLSTSATRRAERKGENGVPLSRIEPSFANEFGQSLSIRHTTTPMQLGLTLSHQTTGYSSVAGQSQAFRDAENFGADLSATYVPHSAAAVGVTVGYSHSEPQESNGRARNNLSANLTVALDVDMVRVQGTVGYLQEHYSNSRFQDFDGIVYNAKAEWYVTPLLTLNAGFVRSTDNSGNADVGRIVGSTIQIGADYELLRNVVLRASYLKKEQNFREVEGFARASGIEASASIKFNRIVAIEAYGRWQCRNAAVIDAVTHYCTDLAGVTLKFRR